MKKMYVLLIFFLALTLESSAQTASNLTDSDYAVYRHVLKQITSYQDLAQAAENSNLQSPLRHAFRNKLELNPVQEEDLNLIAKQCQNQMAVLDKKASVIRALYRQQYPLGKLPSGVKLAPPPPELFKIMSERRSVVADSLTRLKEAFGDEEFAKLDSIVKTKLAPQVYVRKIGGSVR